MAENHKGGPQKYEITEDPESTAQSKRSPEGKPGNQERLLEIKIL